MTPHNATATAIGTHESVLCPRMSTLSPWHATATAISTHDLYTCPFIIGITPNCELSVENTDLVYSVWGKNGQLSLDNATVEWVARDSVGTAIITKTTDDYSIITFGNTLVVHIDIGEAFIPDETLYYTATITTTETYTMTGTLTVVLVQHVTIERLHATLQEPKPRMGAIVAQRTFALRGATPHAIRLEGISREPNEPRIAGQREVQKPLRGATREIRIRGATPTVIRADCVFPQKPRMMGAIQEFKEN